MTSHQSHLVKAQYVIVVETPVVLRWERGAIAVWWKTGVAH